MALKKVPESEYPKSKGGYEWAKKHGTIFRDPERGERLYLRWGFQGRDFTKSLGTTAMSKAMDVAAGIREKAESDFLASQSKTPETEEAKGISVYEEIFKKMVPPSEIQEGQDPGYDGYLETFYPIDSTNENTRYDAEKNLNLFFGSLAKLLNKDLKALHLKDLKKEWLTAAYSQIKKVYSIKTQQKVTVALNKFITWEIKAKRIPADLELLEEIKDKTPSNAEIIKERQRALEDELWSDDELEAVLEACKNPEPLYEKVRIYNEGVSKEDRLEKPLIQPLDYEIYMVMRYIGLPPSDIYQLTHEDFRKGRMGLELAKDRAKESIAEYVQPIVKPEMVQGIPRPEYQKELETLAIIEERLKVTGKGDRLFNQPLIVERFRSKRQNDQTRWVSNFSQRRAVLQEALGLEVKGAKGLRATFITYWVRKGCPIENLAVWVGHSPDSSMIRKFYTQTKEHAYWIG